MAKRKTGLHRKVSSIFDGLSAEFSPDGLKVLTRTMPKDVRLWNLKGQLLSNLNQHTDWVFNAIFSPDGTRILTCSKDNTAKIWYTPEAIIEWLKTAPIPQLTEEEKKEYGID